MSGGGHYSTGRGEFGRRRGRRGVGNAVVKRRRTQNAAERGKRVATITQRQNCRHVNRPNNKNGEQWRC